MINDLPRSVGVVLPQDYWIAIHGEKRTTLPKFEPPSGCVRIRSNLFDCFDDSVDIATVYGRAYRPGPIGIVQMNGIVTALGQPDLETKGALWKVDTDFVFDGFEPQNQVPQHVKGISSVSVINT